MSSVTNNHQKTCTDAPDYSIRLQVSATHHNHVHRPKRTLCHSKKQLSPRVIQPYHPSQQDTSRANVISGFLLLSIRVHKLVPRHHPLSIHVIARQIVGSLLGEVLHPKQLGTNQSAALLKDILL